MTTLSVQDGPMNLKQLATVMFPLGFITYGGPLAHINVLKEKFKAYTTEDEFQELFALCQTLPGPTSTQMVIAIGTNLTQSCLGGLVAFLFFCVPSAIVMLIAGLVIKDASNPTFQLLITGFKYAAIAVIMEAAYKLSKGALKNRFLLGLWLFSIVMSFAFQTSIVALGLIIFGATSNVFYERRQPVQPIPIEETQQVAKPQFTNPLLGYKSLIMYAATFSVFLLLQYSESMYITVAGGFFRTGSLVIGGGHVVLPMLQIELQEYLTEKQFWDAFAMVSCMPGPMFNIAIYIGAVIDGVALSIISEFFMFLPGFFTIFGLLPYWKQYRGLKIVRSVLGGIAAITTGFVVSAVLHLIISSCSDENVAFWIPLLIATLGCGGLYMKQQVPLIVIGGGILNIFIQQYV